MRISMTPLQGNAEGKSPQKVSRTRASNFAQSQAKKKKNLSGVCNRHWPRKIQIYINIFDI